ncbi:MAG: hypothetical protein SW833_18975 [Cyanobacteriota bacterium]|nr:hypothetical protein [Cyanobacteriota bacterium]
MRINQLLPYLLATPLALFSILAAHPARSQSVAQSPDNIPSVSRPVPSDDAAYNEYMRLGYAAAQRGDHRIAARHFRSALYYNPRDREATIAYWNARDAMNQNEEGNESDFDRYMEIGYDATEQGDYQTALINFRRALEERPNDFYATQAIRNTQTYINRGEGATPSELENLDTSASFYPGESPYDRYMRLGYAAVQREEYRTAVGYFRSALYERPDDRQANVAFWNAKGNVGGDEASSASAESDYDRFMRIGYDATERGNFQTALINFRRALEQRPNDEYATQAIRNVQTYINRGE